MDYGPELEWKKNHFWLKRVNMPEKSGQSIIFLNSSIFGKMLFLNETTLEKSSNQRIDVRRKKYLSKTTKFGG